MLALPEHKEGKGESVQNALVIFDIFGIKAISADSDPSVL